VTQCRERRGKLEETVETLRKTHTELLHSRDKCALEIKVRRVIRLKSFFLVGLHF